MAEASLPLHRASTSSSRASTSSLAADGLPPATPSQPIRTEYDEAVDDDEEDDVHDADAAAGLLDGDATEKLVAKGRGRSRTASFSFDFSGRLLQLAASDDVAGAGSGTTGRGSRDRSGNVKESMSLIGGMALIVGIVIGSGIFSSPGVVAKETGSVGTALLVWAGAGLLSWAGTSHLPVSSNRPSGANNFPRRRIQFCGTRRHAAK